MCSSLWSFNDTNIKGTLYKWKFILSNLLPAEIYFIVKYQKYYGTCDSSTFNNLVIEIAIWKNWQEKQK